MYNWRRILDENRAWSCGFVLDVYIMLFLRDLEPA